MTIDRKHMTMAGYGRRRGLGICYIVTCGWRYHDCPVGSLGLQTKCVRFFSLLLLLLAPMLSKQYHRYLEFVWLVRDGHSSCKNTLGRETSKT